MANSVLKIFSICSSVEVLWEAVSVVEVPVSPDPSPALDILRTTGRNETNDYLMVGAVFTTTFGPGGFRATRMRTNHHQHQHHAQAQGQQRENAEPRSILVQLVPLFLLLAFSLLNALPSLFSSPTMPDPRFSFSPTNVFNVERRTEGLGVKYHVNAAEFSGHPIAAELARNTNEKRTRLGPELRKFEGNIERVYKQQLYSHCQTGVDMKERRKDREVGLFGIGTDWEKVKQIDAEPIPACEELRSMGLLK